MKTQRASIIKLLVSIIALFACVLIESRQVKNLTAFITDKTILVDEYRDYIKESFTYGISEEDQEIMDDLLRDHSNTIVIAAPTSACWACFESLINRVIESQKDTDTITIIFPKLDPMRERVLRAKGFLNIYYNPSIDSLSKITISRISHNGWQHIYMNYSDGQEDILDLFIL